MSDGWCHTCFARTPSPQMAFCAHCLRALLLSADEVALRRIIYAGRVTWKTGSLRRSE